MQGYIHDICNRLKYEMEKQDRSGIYGFTQIEMCYHSNRIEGSKLSKDQTLSIFKAGTITAKGTIRSKDVEETIGHFAMFNYMLQTIEEPLTQELIKAFHYKLKSSVWEDFANGYTVGDYKKRENVVGNIQTAKPNEVEEKMKELFDWYNSQEKTLDTLSEFHIRYERIHPFQDGNGRTGRILLFRECLVNNIAPFLIQDENKLEYFQALKEQSVELMSAFFKKEQTEYARAVIGMVFTEDEMCCLECAEWLSDVVKEYCSSKSNYRK